MSPTRNSGNRPQLLFQVKKGTVTAEIHGPRIGWRWRNVRYYRWQKSTKNPSGWDQLMPNRAVDQPYLEQCVKAVRTWLKQEDESLAEIQRPLA